MPVTNYAAHEVVYRKKRLDPEFEGWDKPQGYSEELPVWEELLTTHALEHKGEALDLGCGAGQLSLLLAEKGFNVTAADISGTAIEWAEENAARRALNIRAVCCNLVEDFSRVTDRQYDLVTDGHFFHCIVGVDRQKVLKSIYSTLKPGGIFILKSMVFKNGIVPEDEYFQKCYSTAERAIMVNNTAVRFIPDQNFILREVMAAGFHVISSTVFDSPTFDATDLPTLAIIAQK